MEETLTLLGTIDTEIILVAPDADGPDNGRVDAGEIYLLDLPQAGQ